MRIAYFTDYVNDVELMVEHIAASIVNANRHHAMGILPEEACTSILERKAIDDAALASAIDLIKPRCGTNIPVFLELALHTFEYSGACECKGQQLVVCALKDTVKYSPADIQLLISTVNNILVEQPDFDVLSEECLGDYKLRQATLLATIPATGEGGESFGFYQVFMSNGHVVTMFDITDSTIINHIVDALASMNVVDFPTNRTLN